MKRKGQQLSVQTSAAASFKLSERRGEGEQREGGEGSEKGEGKESTDLWKRTLPTKKKGEVLRTLKEKMRKKKNSH